MTRPKASTGLKALVFLGLAAFILHSVDLDRVGSDMGRIPPATYAVATAILLASVALQALRWKILLKDPSIPYRECYACIGVGTSLAMIAPSSLLADGAVGYWLGKRQHGVLRALSALMVSRILGVVSGILLMLAALPSHLWILRETLMEGVEHPVEAVAITAFVLLVGAAVAWRFRDKIAQLVERALPILKDPLSLGIALGLSLCVQLTQLAAPWVAYRAIGAPVAYHDLMFFLPLIALIGMLPISLGGMGVREGLAIFLLTQLPGVGREAVLAVAGFRYLVMAVTAGVNLALAGALLGGYGRVFARSSQAGTIRTGSAP